MGNIVYGSWVGVATAANTTVPISAYRRQRRSWALESTPTPVRNKSTSGSSNESPNVMNRHSWNRITGSASISPTNSPILRNARNGSVGVVTISLSVIVSGSEATASRYGSWRNSRTGRYRMNPPIEPRATATAEMISRRRSSSRCWTSVMLASVGRPRRRGIRGIDGAARQAGGGSPSGGAGGVSALRPARRCRRCSRVSPGGSRSPSISRRRSEVVRRSSRSDLPMVRPISGMRRGPKMTSARTRMIRISPNPSDGTPLPSPGGLQRRAPLLEAGHAPLGLLRAPPDVLQNRHQRSLELGHGLAQGPETPHQGRRQRDRHDDGGHPHGDHNPHHRGDEDSRGASPAYSAEASRSLTQSSRRSRKWKSMTSSRVKAGPSGRTSSSGEGAARSATSTPTDFSRLTIFWSAGFSTRSSHEGHTKL